MSRRSKKAVRRDELFGHSGSKPYEWFPMFINALRHHMNVTKAAEACGVSRRVALAVVASSPAFQEQYDDCWESIVDEVEEQALRRAIGGGKADAMIEFILEHNRVKYENGPAIEAGSGGLEFYLEWTDDGIEE